MDRELSIKLLRAAMETPEVIDDLWLATECDINPHGLRACLRLDKQLGGEGTNTSNIAVELSFNAKHYLAFIWDSNRYSKDLMEESTKRFPLAKLELSWDVPKGFKPRSGLAGWLEKISLDIIEKFCPAGQRIPSIVVYKPKETACHFPWQEVYSANSFLRAQNYCRLSSKYVSVAGTKAYEMCYKSRNPDWFEGGKMLSLEYAMVPVIAERQMEYRLMLATKSLSDDKPAFDFFVAFFR